MKIRPLLSLCFILTILNYAFLSPADAINPKTDSDPKEIAVERKPEIKPSESSKKLAQLIAAAIVEKSYSLIDSFVIGITATYSVKLDGKSIGDVKFLFSDKHPEERIIFQNTFPEESREVFYDALFAIHTLFLVDDLELSEPNANAIKLKQGYLMEVIDPKNPDRAAFSAWISGNFDVVKKEIVKDMPGKEGNEEFVATYILTEYFERGNIGDKRIVRKMVRFVGVKEKKRTRYDYKFEYCEQKDAVFFKSIEISAKIPEPEQNKYKTLVLSLKLKNVIFEREAGLGEIE